MSSSPFRPRRLRRRSGWGWLLLALFVLVPIVEIYVIIQVGQVIGPWWTIALLIADSIFGTWLVKREGRRAWRALTTTLQSGRMPSRELADGALILVGGTLMVSPGFVTDVFGILMILPFTRPLARTLLARYVGRRLLVVRASGGPGDGPVVRGEVVDDQ
ncbi:MAG: FxsA family protein [Nocardioides sp.]